MDYCNLQVMRAEGDDGSFTKFFGSHCDCAGTPRIANISILSAIINAAVVDFGDRSTPGLDQQVYASAFADFLGILGSGHPSNKIVAFANSIASALTTPSGIGGYGTYTDYTGALVELAHAADADQSFAGAFQQVDMLSGPTT